MPTIVDYAGQEIESDRDVWTHGGADSHLPLLDRVILDLIDRLGYSPAEISRALKLPLSHVCGTFWRSRWSAQRVANRVASTLRDSGDFDPRHAIVFELSAVCGYSFVEIGEALGFDRGHACRVANETAEKLRERLQSSEFRVPSSEESCASHRERDLGLHSELGTRNSELALITALPGGDDEQTARDCRLHYARNETLTPLERLTLWREMLDAGDFASQAALAQAVGVADSTVRNLLRLLTLPKVWLDRVIHGAIPLCFLRPLVAIKDRADVLAALAERLDARSQRPSYLAWRRIVREQLSCRGATGRQKRKAA